MRCLITGASGYIGSILFESLKKHPKVSALFGVARSFNCWPHWVPPSDELICEKFYTNLTDERQVKYLLEQTRPDVIFHLAGIPVVKTNDNSPFQITDVNVGTTHKLLHYCKEGTIFVLASTVLVYGNTANIQGCVISDEYSPIIQPTSVYATTKASAELLVETYHRQDKIIGRNLRLTATVGKIKPTHGILKDFIEKLQSNSEYLDVIGAYPGSLKPFSYITDVVRAFELVGLELDDNCLRAVNVCPNDQLTVDQIARIVMEVTGIYKEINWLGAASTWKGDNPKVATLARKLQRLGWHREFNTSRNAMVQAVKDILNS